MGLGRAIRAGLKRVGVHSKTLKRALQVGGHPEKSHKIWSRSHRLGKMGARAASLAQVGPAAPFAELSGKLLHRLNKAVERQAEKATAAQSGVASARSAQSTVSARLDPSYRRLSDIM